MTEVISIRFRNAGKVYYFDPNGLVVKPGDHVIVETAKGLEYGECTAGNHEVEDSAIVPPLRPAIRIATEEDRKIAAQNAEKEKKAFEICQQKIEAHGLEMKLVDVEYSFDGSKIIFFFTADGRVDFRELVKDLVSIFRVRIELRQIGVRDGAKMLGGLGICGRPFCCSTFLDEFHPVSIKMAKTQALSLNPTKISGTCGRLMCCLKYEQDAYEELIKNAPKVSASVVTPYGEGIVTEVNLLKQIAKVRVDEGETAGLHSVPFCDIGKTVSTVPKVEESPSSLITPSILDKFINILDKPSAKETPAGKTSEKAASGEAEGREQKTEPQAAPAPEQQPQASKPRPISELSSKQPAPQEAAKPQEAKKKNRRRNRDKRKADKSGSKLRNVIEELEHVVKPAAKKSGGKKQRKKQKPPIADN